MYYSDDVRIRYFVGIGNSQPSEKDTVVKESYNSFTIPVRLIPVKINFWYGITALSLLQAPL